MHPQLVSLIVDTLQKLNGHHQTGSAINLNPNTPLFGPDGVLDSLGMVMLLVSLEETIEDTHGVSINLADEKALSKQNSLYGTIGSLATYASRLIQEAAARG